MKKSVLFNMPAHAGYFLSPLFLLGILLNSSVAIAQQQRVANANLQDVVISANRLPAKITDVLINLTLIDRAELNLAGQSSLFNALANLPSVQISRHGSYRSSRCVFLRGASGTETVIG